MYVYACMHVYTFVRGYVRMFACMNVFMCACVYLRMYVYNVSMRVFMYLQTHADSHKHSLTLRYTKNTYLHTKVY